MYWFPITAVSIVLTTGSKTVNCFQYMCNNKKFVKSPLHKLECGTNASRVSQVEDVVYCKQQLQSLKEACGFQCRLPIDENMVFACKEGVIS